jgi:hypothetical protein
MAHIRPNFMTKPKAPFLAAFLLLFCLSACSSSWITDPLARYVKKKTGIEIKWEKISLGINPLRLESRGIQAHFKQGPVFWEVKIQDLRTIFGWTLSWENLPWPDIYIRKVSMTGPRFSGQLPEPGKGGDWAAWLKKCPALKQIEVEDLGGRLALGKNVFQLAPGARMSASFSPDQGGKIEYRIKELNGRWASKGLKIQAGARGSLELTDLQDRPRWQGPIAIFHGHLISEKGKASRISGTFDFLYQSPLIKVSSSSAHVQEIEWKKDDLSFRGLGTISLSGSILDKGGEKKETLALEGDLKFDSLQFDLKKGTRAVKGKAGGGVRISGPASRLLIKGSLRSTQTDLDLSPVLSQETETEILFEGRFPDLSFPLVRARADRTSLQLSAVPFLITNPETRFSVQLAGGGRQIQIKNMELKTDNWGNLFGSLFFDSSKGPVPNGKVRAEGFPLTGLLTRLFPQSTNPLPNLPCQGTVEWTKDPASPYIFNVSLSPASFSFHLPENDLRGEKIKTRLEVRGKWFPEDGKVQMILDHRLSGGSLSRPPWIFYFDDNPLSARMEGTYQKERKTGTLRGSGVVDYDPVGALKVSGEWHSGSSSPFYLGTIEVNNLPLKKGFPLLIGVPLSSRYPILKTLAPQGLLKAQVLISKGNEAYELRGRLTGSGIELSSQETSFLLKDMSFDLPFHLSSPRDVREKIFFSESGFIQVGKFQGQQVVFNNLRIPILAKTNQFELSGRIEVPLWGGRGNLSSFRILDPLGKMKLETAISLKDLDLMRMFPSLNIPGTLNGDLEPVRLDAEMAQIEGTLEAHVFDGLVEGNNWLVRKPFSADRIIQGDLFFDHINLEALTQRFSFGKITGYVQGGVIGLSLRNFRPEGFNLWIRTQEVPGVPKKIQVKAIENISLLGTGWESLDVLRQGFNRFITEYAYREIGLACSLKDDRFTLHGTIVEDGVEYLVRSPGWFGIDIVNKNPDNEISFSDIMDRIKRIGGKPREGESNEKN